MDIRELRIQQQILETRLHSAVTALVYDFQSRTGESPSSIDIVITEVTEIGNVRPKHIISEIKVRIEI